MKQPLSSKKALTLSLRTVIYTLIILVVMFILASNTGALNKLTNDGISSANREYWMQDYKIKCDLKNEEACRKTAIKKCPKEDKANDCDKNDATLYKEYLKVADCDLYSKCTDEQKGAWSEFKAKYIDRKTIDEIAKIGHGDADLDSAKDNKENNDDTTKSSQTVIDNANSNNLEIINKIGELTSSGGSFSAKRIVLHHTGGSSLDSAVQAMQKRRLGVHYIIDKDGKIYQYVNIDEKTYHACGANYETIGIEIVNTGLGEDYTREQYQSLNTLIPNIKSSLKTTKTPFVIGHNEVDEYYKSEFEKSGCATGKWDPSPNFNWAAINIEKDAVAMNNFCNLVKTDKNLNFNGNCYTVS